jgi:hypothetical protein
MILRTGDEEYLLIASVSIFAVRRTEVIDLQTLVFAVAFAEIESFEMHHLALQQSVARLRHCLFGVRPRYPFLLRLLPVFGFLLTISQNSSLLPRRTLFFFP